MSSTLRVSEVRDPAFARVSAQRSRPFALRHSRRSRA